jgi:hypothetical protein
MERKGGGGGVSRSGGEGEGDGEGGEDVVLDFGQCMEALAVLAEENGLNEIRPAVWGERVAGISVREVSVSVYEALSYSCMRP